MRCQRLHLPRRYIARLPRYGSRFILSFTLAPLARHRKYESGRSQKGPTWERGRGSISWLLTHPRWPLRDDPSIIPPLMGRVERLLSVILASRASVGGFGGLVWARSPLVYPLFSPVRVSDQRRTNLWFHLSYFVKCLICVDVDFNKWGRTTDNVNRYNAGWFSIH